MPRTMGGNSGLFRSGITVTMEPDRLVLRLRAMGLGRYPSSVAARLTRSAVSSLTRGRVWGLSAREAVAGCPPASAATSRRVIERMRRGYPIAATLQQAAAGPTSAGG